MSSDLIVSGCDYLTDLHDHLGGQSGKRVCMMQAGLADIKGWGQYMGPQWCGEGSDIERALEHSNQAVRYLISGKDDCVRKACKVTSLPSPAHGLLPHSGSGKAVADLYRGCAQ